MVAPSGEKATDTTSLLCALCFSALSSREAVASTGAVRSGLRVEGCQRQHACIPDFDRLVVGARHDLGSIMVEGHRVDPFAVCVLFFRLELQ